MMVAKIQKFFRGPREVVLTVPGRFKTLAVSKQPNYLLGRFETFLAFETAWPVQNLVSKWPNQ